MGTDIGIFVMSAGGAGGEGDWKRTDFFGRFHSDLQASSGEDPRPRFMYFVRCDGSLTVFEGALRIDPVMTDSTVNHNWVLDRPLVQSTASCRKEILNRTCGLGLFQTGCRLKCA